MNFLSQRKCILLSAVCLSVTGIMGCGALESNLNKVIIRDNEQEYIECEEVMQGDLDVDLHLILRAEDSREVGYHADHDEMEVEAVNFQSGDSVHKGDILVTFKADELEKSMLQIDKKIDEDVILLEHIKKMKAIYPHSDYSAQEKRILNDLEVRRVEKEENSAWLAGYTLVAEGSGVVKNVSSVWDTTKVGPNDTLITIVYSSEVYSGSTSDDYDFKIGETYSVDVGLSRRDIVLQEIEEDGVDDEGNTVRRLTFILEGVDETPVSDNEIQLNIERDKLKDALYIPKSAVVTVDGRHFVYVVDDEGVPMLRQIVTGASVDGIIVVKSGLTKGEKVVTEL